MLQLKSLQTSIKLIALLFVFILFYGCGYRKITTPELPSDAKEGVVISATHKKTWLLYFTSGITAKIDNEPHGIPWSKSQFFPLNPGNHKFELWNHWFWQKAGMAKGCFSIESNQIISLKYMPPNLTFQKGIVEITDNRSNQRIDVKKNCLN